METQHRNRAATLREARPDELIQDVLRIGPAPHPSREAFVTVVNVVLVGVVLALLQPEPVFVAVALGVLAAFTALRWAAGAKKWRNA